MPYVDKNGVVRPGAAPEDDEDLPTGSQDAGSGNTVLDEITDDATTPPPTYTPPQSPYADLDRTVLSRIEEGLQGPSQAVQTMMRQGNEAVAQRARQLESAAGARAAKSGMIGQGNENTLADDVGRDILSTLSKQQQDNTILVGNEQQQFLSQAQDALQRQQQQQQAYNAAIGQLAQSNPVLAAKFTQFMLTGGSGEIGDFTPAEQAELAAWVAENKEMNDLIREETLARIDSLRTGQGGSVQRDTIQAAINAKDLSTLTPENLKALASNPAYAQQAKAAGLITTPAAPPSYDFVMDAFRSSSAKAAAKAEYQEAYANLQPGSVIEKDGNLYQIKEVGVRDSKKSMGNTRGRYVTTAFDLKTGNVVELYPSSWFDVD